MFYDLHTSKWGLKMIAENFQDWLYQGCVERDKERRETLKEEAKRIKVEGSYEENGYEEHCELVSGKAEEAEDKLRYQV